MSDKNRKKIHVIAIVDGTVTNYHFTCDNASRQIFADGRGCIAMDNGSDEQGPILTAQFRRVEVILTRPTG